jgi:hypothetical protein
MEPNLYLYDCKPYGARLTVRGCETNRKRARAAKGHRVNMVEACLTCPGVIALANGSGPVAQHPCKGERGEAEKRPPHRIGRSMDLEAQQGKRT